MSFKLPSLKGRVNSNRSLVSHGLPLFDWIQLQDKEEAIGRGCFGLVFVPRDNGKKVIVKKLLSEDKQEQRLFLKKAEILHGIKSEHVKFQPACTNPCAMMLEYFFFAFAPFGGSDKVSSLDKFLQLC